MFNFASINLTTGCSLAIIVIVFIIFIIYLIRVLHTNVRIKTLIGSGIDSQIVQESIVKDIWSEYTKSISIDTSDGIKSNIPAASYFNEENVAKDRGINLKLLDSASGILVGLGLLGTFLGLTIGVSGFDSSNSENIQQSIQHLLDGMGTAFLTSLLGMSCSIIYTIIHKNVINSIHNHLQDLSEMLDEIFYIDDSELQEIKHKEIVERVVSALSNEFDAKLVYTSETGEQVPIANAIREVLKENEEQSRALKSFSTDLAIELNNGFDEVLSRQMQEKILPLMENVDATTKAIIEHIDRMAQQVSSPATEMIQNVVDKLQHSLTDIISEFKTSLSNSTTSELDRIAEQLASASQNMADFPQQMGNISTTLQQSIKEVKAAISEIVQTSASATEKMGTFLNGTITGLSASVQQSFKEITDDVNNKQADLIALQEVTTTQTKKLLETFNIGIERLEKVNDSIVETMTLFTQAQGNISGSTAHLQTITGKMESATHLFSMSQQEYSTKMEEIQKDSIRSIKEVSELLGNAGNLTQDYAQKFELIKQGLSMIFAQLQKGLTEYSRTVQETTQNYLNQYSTNLTKTTDALASTIQQQNEVVEMLNETIEKSRRK